jgi:hypothetical protein
MKNRFTMLRPAKIGIGSVPLWESKRKLRLCSMSWDGKTEMMVNANMALKALLLFCVLSVVFCVVANEARSPSLNAVSPTIRIDRTEFFLGEQVAFEIGKRTIKDVDGPALAETLCQLKVVRPDGKEIVQHEGGPGVYDGPSRLSFLSQPELLNDIDDHLAVGRYQILYACGLQKTSISIQLRELPSLRDIHVTLQFPTQLRLSKDTILKVGVTVSNGSAIPIKIVIPESNYWARVIAYADYAQAWTLFNSNAVAQAVNNPNYRTRISSANLDRLKLHEIAAKGSYSTEIELHGAAAGGGLLDSQWLPTNQFEIVGGLVLHLFSPMDGLPQSSDRPIELLIRSKTCYAVTGERQSTGCEGAIKHWPHAPLD